MSTTRPAWATDFVAATARRRPAVCGCGQDLDVCMGNHCSRCGHTLRRHALTTAA